MEGSRVSDHSTVAEMIIQSHKGPYTVRFYDMVISATETFDLNKTHFLIDERIAELYFTELSDILGGRSVLKIPATEVGKSLDHFSGYVSHLVEKGVRRDHRLCAIGGGIIQDITCFLAATMLRGIAWIHFPTTLLAQADSCIGSKSSINAGGAKNILGTFTPPNEVHICNQFLKTLDEVDIRSGIGEILKVHAIEGPAEFDALAADYEKVFVDSALMQRYIRRALEIKQRYIEIDEFDVDSRNVFNYGHSFGHAIEAATNFIIPHGIAVTIGMDMANFVAMQLGCGGNAFERMHRTLYKNYRGFDAIAISVTDFLPAIMKDKKNIGDCFTLILLNSEGVPSRTRRPNDSVFRGACADYLNTIRLAESPVELL